MYESAIPRPIRSVSVELARYNGARVLRTLDFFVMQTIANDRDSALSPAIHAAAVELRKAPAVARSQTLSDSDISAYLIGLDEDDRPAALALPFTREETARGQTLYRPGVAVFSLAPLHPRIYTCFLNAEDADIRIWHPNARNKLSGCH